MKSPAAAFVLSACCCCLLVAAAVAQDAKPKARRGGYPPDMPGARTEVYKTVDGVKLNLYIYEPGDLAPADRRPAIVFFFGGGWTGGSPQQFVPQCEYFALRGIVAMAADYRVAGRHHVKAVDCVRDAKSAIRFVRANAERLGVDPKRIVAAGGSAGGHLAAATGTLDDFDTPGEDTNVSSRPNAMLLFNPAVMLAPAAGVEIDADKVASLAQRVGTAPEALSPYHHVTKGAPPTAIFHGTSDGAVPYDTVVAFTRAMQDAGNRCTLNSYPDQGHGFFNYGRGDNAMFVATLEAADRFLAELGYVQGEPTVAEFLQAKATD